MDYTLNIPEEIFLLSIDAEGNQLNNREFDIVLASSILMELALQNRIDTDLDFVIPDKSMLTGIDFLDEFLTEIHSTEKKQSISYWIINIYSRIDKIKKSITGELVNKGIIRVENERILIVFGSKRYPIIKQKEIVEAKLRIRDIIFSNEIPEIKDIVIISLLHYGSIEFILFTENEMDEYRGRIEQIAKMDMIGQAISRTISEITLAMRAKVLLGIKTAQQKLDDLVESKRKEMNIKDDENLPDWLKKGTVQYRKTLDFIEENGKANIEFDPKKKTYRII
jgi:hypothetical protein